MVFILVDLDKSFRFTQPILDVSSRFIQKNPLQLKKKITSKPSTFKKTIEIIENEFGNQEYLYEVFKKINIDRPNNKRWDVVILGRYNHLEKEFDLGAESSIFGFPIELILNTQVDIFFENQIASTDVTNYGNAESQAYQTSSEEFNVGSGGDVFIANNFNMVYGTNKYLEIVNKLKSKRPDIAMSSDFIVGFPGESDDDFDLISETITKKLNLPFSDDNTENLDMIQDLIFSLYNLEG